MRSIKRSDGHGSPWISALALLVLSHPAQAESLDPATSDPRKIAEAAEERNAGDRQMATLTMSVIDRTGRARVRELVLRRMRFDEGSKLLLLFAAPADMRNTGFLMLDQRDGNKDDDQWLYLPSLHKSTRIAASDRSGGFLGSDISYADMAHVDVRQYEYKLLEMSVVVGSEECWRIEARPNTEKAKQETGYLKSELWVSKQKLVPIQRKIWVREGKKLKYVKYENIRKIDNVWTTHKVTVRSVRGGQVQSTTVLELSGVRYNDASVSHADFTERRLEKGI